MKRNFASLAVALVLVVGTGVFVYAQKQASLAPADAPDEAVANGVNDAADVSANAQSFAAQVPAHSTRESCWTIINGSVYDLTSWIPEHPGGEDAILQLCGTDGSAKFNGKHGGSSRQETVLAGFRIGSVE